MARTSVRIVNIEAVSDRDAVLACLDDIDTLLDKLATLSIDALNPAEMLTVLARRELQARRQPSIDHRLLNRLVSDGAPLELGATSMHKVLSHRLKISARDAHRRLDEAADLGPRRTLTGQPLEPKLPTVAAAQARGEIGAEHIAIIRSFFNDLPAGVDLGTTIDAERHLAALATEHTPEYFNKAAKRLLATIDQDGTFNDKDYRRRRGITIGKQGNDGLSPIAGNLDPETRAVFDAILAKLAAPGRCNSDDDTPCVSGTPSDEQIRTDTRTAAQRNHDALLAAGRIVLSTKKLGNLNGLPVTVIVSTTLAQLETAAGVAVTAAGTLIPIPDLIRMAAHAHHYLAIFNGKSEALHLGRARRIATPAQRIVLYSLDRGCTAPGCTAPAWRCQVHHANSDWIDGGQTNIDDLTLACGPDNRKVTKNGWKTQRRNGRTEWTPPPHLDTGQPRINNYHHPEKMLLDPPQPDSG